MHCTDFWRKWRKDGNFCGLGNQQKYALDRYLEIIDEIVADTGANEETLYSLIPASALYGSGLYSLKKDALLRKEVMDNIKEFISHSKKVRRIDVDKWVQIGTWTEDFARKNCIPSFMGTFASMKCNKNRSIKRAVESIKGSELQWTGLGPGFQDVGKRIDLLHKFLTQGQHNALQLVIGAGYAENEYDALCVAIFWAAESLKHRRKKPTKIFSEIQERVSIGETTSNEMLGS